MTKLLNVDLLGFFNKFSPNIETSSVKCPSIYFIFNAMYTNFWMCLFQRGNLWQMTIRMTDFLQSHLLITQGMGISIEDCRENSNMAKGNLPLIKGMFMGPH